MIFKCRLKDNTCIAVEAENGGPALTERLRALGFSRSYVSSYDSFSDELAYRENRPIEMCLNPEDFKFLQNLLDENVVPRNIA